MKPRHHLYLDEDLTRQLDLLAAKPGTSKSAIVADALRHYLARQGSRDIDDALKIRLDRQSRHLERLERDLQVLLESLALFVRYQLTVTAPLPEPLKPDQRRPTMRVAAANRAALQEPSAHGYINAIQVYPYSEGALYRLYAAPEQISDIALEPGEQLTAVSAGDTVRWVIGDTTSGTGESKRVHVLVKPFAPGLRTNLIITTDRRFYHLQLESTVRTSMAAISWTYPQGTLLALQRRNAAAEAVAPAAPTASLSNRSGSATPFPATARPGGRCAPSMMAPRPISSSPPGLIRARRHPCSWSGRTVRPSWSITGCGATSTSSTGCSPPLNCAWVPIPSRWCGSAAPMACPRTGAGHEYA